MMVRRGAVLAVGAAASREPKVVQAACAIAKRPLGDVGEQPAELVLAHHAVRAEHVEQTPVDVGQHGRC
jgi:hypothetical protein